MADVCLHMSQYEDEGMSEYGGDGDELADVLEIGENFAVPAEVGNKENVTYYILQCQKRKFLVCDRFKCPWGVGSKKGSMLWRGCTTRSGVFRRTPLCILVSHVLRISPLI
jgi:hypothetical protein